MMTMTYTVKPLINILIHMTKSQNHKIKTGKGGKKIKESILCVCICGRLTSDPGSPLTCMSIRLL